MAKLVNDNKATTELAKWDYTAMKKLENLYGSSFYLLDVNKLKGNYNKINLAFKGRYENFIIGYSYKTNYLPYLCKELLNLGAYAEVVSRLEYDLAIHLGVNPKKIIFNGPIKSKEDIFLALKNESIVNIDSMYEIAYVKEFAQINPNTSTNIGVRVNFDLSEGGVSILQDGYDVSRFGICVENGSFHEAITKLNGIKNVKVIGLHGHFSTSKRTVESYRKKTERLCRLAKDYIIDTLEFIDIGGGIYGELPMSFQIPAPSFDDYAEAICSVMHREFPHKEGRRPLLILEPGVSMVANTMTFVSKVIENKKVTDKNFVLVDASVHNIKPTMHKSNLPMKVITKNQNKKREQNFHIVGYTCMEKDYLAHEIYGEMPEKDDYIIFENVGAYTIVFNPPFIKERPCILAFDQNKVIEVRKKETFKQFFNKELYCF